MLSSISKFNTSSKRPQKIKIFGCIFDTQYQNVGLHDKKNYKKQLRKRKTSNLETVTYLRNI